MSQAELAREVGVEPSLITSMLRGRTKSSDFVETISDFLDIPHSGYDLLPDGVRELALAARKLDKKTLGKLLKVVENT